MKKSVSQSDKLQKKIASKKEVDPSRRKLTIIIGIISLLTLGLFGCYPMPKEGEYSTLPTTNHPDIVGSQRNPLYFQ